jgi:phosphotransferase system HPr (HPr) family protein
VSSFDAQVHVTNVSRGTAPVDGRSLISIIALGADQGHQLRIEADGPQAREAVAALRTQIEGGFGEL